MGNQQSGGEGPGTVDSVGRLSPEGLQLERLGALGGWIQDHPLGGALTVALVVLLVGALLHRVVRHYILRFLEYIARQTPRKWDQALFDARLPQRLAWGVPLLVWYYGAALVPHLPPDALLVGQRVLLATMVVVVVRAFDAFLDGVNRIYMENPGPGSGPSRGSCRWPTWWPTWRG